MEFSIICLSYCVCSKNTVMIIDRVCSVIHRKENKKNILCVNSLQCAHYAACTATNAALTISSLGLVELDRKIPGNNFDLVVVLPIESSIFKKYFHIFVHSINCFCEQRQPNVCGFTCGNIVI